MARYKLILAYDGTRFAGSQRQANARTVQGEFEKALRGLGWSGSSILMAGRTDAGVHATGQVAAFDFEWRHSDLDLVHALNAALPADAAVRAASQAGAGFHPRFDARSRAYRYRMFCQPIRDPLRERLAWRVWPDVNGDDLQKAASVFAGRQDFACFGSPTSPNGHTERTVIQSEWRRLDGEWQYEIRADAFLYRMVRRLVFVQVAVAHGKISAETLASSLAGPAGGRGGNDQPAGLAPAQGLTLVEVTY